VLHFQFFPLVVEIVGNLLLVSEEILKKSNSSQKWVFTFYLVFGKTGTCIFVNAQCFEKPGKVKTDCSGS